MCICSCVECIRVYIVQGTSRLQVASSHTVSMSTLSNKNVHCVLFNVHYAMYSTQSTVIASCTQCASFALKSFRGPLSGQIITLSAELF